MREIKFRAWDLKTKSFYKPTYRALECKLHDISITLDGIVMERTLEHCASMLNNDNYILMQYTGLKDKNGKEIYEGDILKSLGSDVSGVVYISDLGSYFLQYYDENLDEMDMMRLDFNTLKHREVIGNIYENPELLNND